MDAGWLAGLLHAPDGHWVAGQTMGCASIQVVGRMYTHGGVEGV